LSYHDINIKSGMTETFDEDDANVNRNSELATQNESSLLAKSDTDLCISKDVIGQVNMNTTHSFGMSEYTADNPVNRTSRVASVDEYQINHSINNPSSGVVDTVMLASEKVPTVVDSVMLASHSLSRDDVPTDVTLSN
jgi:hypothetical protein